MTNTPSTPVADSHPRKSEYWAAWQKCRELGHQLSEALAATGDLEFAFIQPASFPHAVGFGQVKSDLAYPIEYPVQTVDRLAERMAFALDDWAEHTTWDSVAHIYPASTGRGVWYENMARHGFEQDSKDLQALIDRCTAALEAFDASNDDPRSGEADFPPNREINASRKALLDFRPASLSGVKAKAKAMLSFRNFHEWDDLDRIELIRAFAGEDA